LQELAQRHMVSRAQCETTKSKHMHPHFSATTRLPQELGAGSCTFEARQYSAYRFRLPPTPGMWLVQFNPRSAQPTTEWSLIDTDVATPSPIRSPIPYLSILNIIIHKLKYKNTLYLASDRIITRLLSS